MDIEFFITDIQDYHAHVYSKDTHFSLSSFSSFFRTKTKFHLLAQVLIVTHYDCEEND